MLNRSRRPRDPGAVAVLEIVTHKHAQKCRPIARRAHEAHRQFCNCSSLKRLSTSKRALLPPAQPAPAPPGAPRRSGRAPAPKAPKVIVDPPAPVRRRKRGTPVTPPVAPASTAPPRRSGRAPAPKVIVDALGPALRCERGLPIQGDNRPRPRSSEGAYQKQSGKWSSAHFPGREFDDLDAYRAAKKQRMGRRSEYFDQAYGTRKKKH